MVKSIRVRLALWYGTILVAAIAGFAGILYSRQAWTTWDRVDQELGSAVLYLDATLRGLMPSPKLDQGEEPFEPKRKWGKRPQNLADRLQAELVLPESMRRPDEPTDQRLRFVVWHADGTILKADPPSEDPRPDVGNELTWSRQEGRRQATMRGPAGTTLLVERSVQREQHDLRTFLGILVGTGGAVVVVGLAGGWLLSGRLVRPIGSIAQTASRISASSLNERLDPARLDTELVELAQVLNAMFARLQEEFERQARFTADASHELRTPLAVLLGNVDLALSRPRTAEEYQSTLRSCREAATRMRAMVDGLLTLARVDAGRLEMQRVLLDLRTIVRDAADAFQMPAERAQIRLLSEWPEEPIRIVGDRLFLGRVLANLLTNALRYTPSGGGVRLTANVEQGQAVVRVRDSGVGIAPEHQAKIFQRFFRVDDSRARETGGCGLGLAICKSIIDLHGGTMSVESTVGEGSTFILRLPLA